jgi:hypothetical protein
MENILLNVTSDPVKIKHISWRVERDTIHNTITLYEIRECYYPHPQAPDHALIQRLEENNLLQVLLNSPEGASLKILEYALANTTLMVKNMNLV